MERVRWKWVLIVFQRGKGLRPSVILLIPDRLPVPTQRFKQLAIRFDHFIEPANVGVQVSPALRDTRNVFLHIAAQTLPLHAATTESEQVMKVRSLAGEAQEFVVVVNVP